LRSRRFLRLRRLYVFFLLECNNLPGRKLDCARRCVQTHHIAGRLMPLRTDAEAGAEDGVLTRERRQRADDECKKSFHEETNTTIVADMSPVSAQAVRDFLLQAAELGNWTARDAAKFLNLSTKDVNQALTALESVGYVERVPRAKDTKDTWRNTPSGNSVAGVSAAKPIKRETAADKLDELVERAHKVNDDPHYLFRVVRAVVYGPYLTETAKLKNIDIAVELRPKEKNKQKQEQRMKERADEAEATGKRSASYAKRRDWGRQEVLDFLKSRSRAISIGELTDWILGQPRKELL
jgi:DNA-binding MarR family transcriptional regulator